MESQSRQPADLGRSLLEQIVLSSTIALASEYWQKQSVHFRPPADRADVFAAFSAFQQIPTSDVLDLYQRLDGFAHHQYCQNHFSLWPLAEIRTENAFNPTADIWFADYLISAHFFSLRAEDRDTSSVHVQYHYQDGQIESVRVADSLQQFLLLLVNDPESVHVFPLPKADLAGNNSQSTNWWQTVRDWLHF